MAEKFRGSIRDWVIAAKERGIDISRLDSDKVQDTVKLEKLDMPIDRNFMCSYREFNAENKELADFMGLYKYYVVRAIPAPGREDLPRKPKLDLRSFGECKNFIDDAVRGHEEAYNIILSEFSPQIYGGTLISASRFVRGEIGRSLADLCLCKEIPLASFEIDKSRVGYITDKTEWKLEADKTAKKCLWKALMHITLGFDMFDPIMHRGYFEFIVKENLGIRFVDYKDNEWYLV